MLYSLRPRRECEYDNIIEAINGPNEVREIDCNIVHKKQQIKLRILYLDIYYQKYSNNFTQVVHLKNIFYHTN